MSNSCSSCSLLGIQRGADRALLSNRPFPSMSSVGIGQQVHFSTPPGQSHFECGWNRLWKNHWPSIKICSRRKSFAITESQRTWATLMLLWHISTIENWKTMCPLLHLVRFLLHLFNHQAPSRINPPSDMRLEPQQTPLFLKVGAPKNKAQTPKQGQCSGGNNGS